jgi:hypothetical protein
MYLRLKLRAQDYKLQKNPVPNVNAVNLFPDYPEPIEILPSISAFDQKLTIMT